MTRRGLVVAVALPVLAQVLLGVLVGVGWWLLAPTGEVLVAGAVVVAPDVPELEAAQDGTYALLSVVAGLVCGGWLTAAPGRRPALRATGIVAGSMVGATIAWGVGTLLGPASVAAQQAAGAEALQSPLALSAYGVLGVWPAVTAGTAFLGLLLAGLLSARERP